MDISYRARRHIRKLSVGQAGSNEGNQGGGELHFDGIEELLSKADISKLTKRCFENDSRRLDNERRG
jgi:hypothetical protein